MSHKRVVITGLGAVTSIGIGAEAFARSLRKGASGVSEITVFDTSGFTSKNGCEIRDFDPQAWVHRLNPETIGRSSQFSIAAARMAIADSRIDPKLLSQNRCGVSIGTTDGESQLIDWLTEKWVKQGPAQLDSDSDKFRQVPADRLSLNVAQEFDLHGEAVTISTACAAGNYAIGHAYDLIAAGDADFMLCGGADSMCRKTFAGFYRLGTIAPSVCQPFDRNRQGLLTGEGAGILFLESLESAIARGAHIYAEILGYGVNCDANHMVAPDKNSIAKCIRLAHKNAGIDPNDVDYISAHGTGTQANDLTEAGAILEVFGDKTPPTSSIKSMIGHTMGAASALSSIACAIALQQSFIPPTINCQSVDPECGLDCVPNKARSADLHIVQNNAFAFGGNNSVVIFSKCNV
ncbi:beta-ketoacyl-[acyl-carrier-protein] synthase family protein [Nostoc favosum]|uniref:Beta-ketoacyl-[acyl-carrier-protein] synthase family protein n=1 Tax=Nostoc favosum CHAB5714 TaxID=2780399 RepID=A0ABS8IG82_9NOSO|nr:beta-ketoacyl-[acyl-carrier-protein] synthase family protein [Nostoc favosum]MCC5603260.1 beta-ketoacyl-[acyl-carrier-protein] synthase family protein [Nostoc favosum CHAB5714]